jgi:hypothetical protein
MILPEAAPAADRNWHIAARQKLAFFATYHGSDLGRPECQRAGLTGCGMSAHSIGQLLVPARWIAR